MSDVDFIVPGVPVPKGRPRFARHGKFVTAYTPAKTTNYENIVALCAKAAMSGRAAIEGAVAVSILVCFTPPASWPKRRREEALADVVYPVSRADVDNLAKSVSDACNGIVWVDDSQIVDLTVKKRYGPRAGVAVGVEKL